MIVHAMDPPDLFAYKKAADAQGCSPPSRRCCGRRPKGVQVRSAPKNFIRKSAPESRSDVPISVGPAEPISRASKRGIPSDGDLEPPRAGARAAMPLASAGGSAMSPVGWDALRLWGDDVLASNGSPAASPTTCGACASTGSSRSVVSVARSDADLAWETELLQHLDREGLTVPVPIPTTDGRLFADGLVVMTYVEGGPPETEADWRRVAEHAPPAASVDAGLAATPGLAIVDRPPARRDRDEDRPRRDAAGGRCSMPGSVGAARRTPDMRRPRRPQQPWQRPHDRGPGRADRLGRVACRRPRP